MQRMTHDAYVDALIALRDGTAFPFDRAVRFFVVGVSGRVPRGRSVLMDWLRLQHFKPHAFEGARHCEICGVPAEVEIRAEAALASAHAGHASNEVVEDLLPRWEEVLTLPDPVPSEQDWDILRALLARISEAEADETPGALEKRIAKARVLPKTDKYKRHGILQTLAECGVLPNLHCMALYDGQRLQREWWAAHHQMKGAPRSDIVLPLAGWRGQMGVDMGRAREVFGL